MSGSESHFQDSPIRYVPTMSNVNPSFCLPYAEPLSVMLPQTQLPVIPAESNPRPIRLVSDLSSYKRLAATIPSAELAARRKRLRAGDVATVSTIWRSRLRMLPINRCHSILDVMLTYFIPNLIMFRQLSGLGADLVGEREWGCIGGGSVCMSVPKHRCDGKSFYEIRSSSTHHKSLL